MIELERTYLVKQLPPDLTNHPHKEILDVYLPKDHPHPTLRLRKNSDKFEMTKKQPVQDGDASRQEEQTIRLTEQEFTELATLPGKRVRKFRYQYPYQGRMAEIDVFQDDLSGLVVADFEFDTEAEKDVFAMPDFCLAEVTQETFLAGGMLCGKSYGDIEIQLHKFTYTKIIL